MTELSCERCTLRPWRTGDEISIVEHADNYNVWRHLGDRFPRPYTINHARWWIDNVRAIELIGLAIEVDGRAVGGVGCMGNEDVYKFTGRLGYWLGEALWGRGIVTEAVSAFVPHVFEETNLVRIEAGVFGHNTRSARVLEKNGFRLESRQVKAVYKDGAFHDLLLYVRLRDEIPPELQ